MGVVQGQVAPGFEAVREIFEAQFANGEHVGAAVAMYHAGRPVVDLWGGWFDEARTRPWERDTMAVCYSTTKGLAATCVHVCADRGLIDYDARVATYWPEFAQNGKDAITVRQILSHQSGMSIIPDSITTADLVDWEKVIHAIEAEPPAWEPGTESGYHAITFGFLTGELVRRVSGKSIGTFLRDEVCVPLGIEREMYIGAPADAEPRIAPFSLHLPEPTPEQEKMREQFFGPGSIAARSLGPADGALNELLNSRAGHGAEIPAVSGIMTARALARVYGAMACYGEIDGVRIMREDTVRRATAQQTLRPDKVVIVPVAWSLGYMNGQPGWPQGSRNTAFGHPGFGGSVGFADPEIGMSFGLVLTELQMGLTGAGRASTLADAARAAIAAHTEAA